MVTLKELLPRAGRIAEGQPGRVVGRNRAIQQSHALVFEMQHEAPVHRPRYLAQVDLQRLNCQACRLAAAAGQLRQKIVEGPIEVRCPLRLPGRLGQVGPTQSTQEALQVALLDDIFGLIPFGIASQYQLIKGAAGATRGKDKRTEERLRADGNRPAVARAVAQGRTILVAITRLIRVDAGTRVADNGHDHLTCGGMSPSKRRWTDYLRLLYAIGAMKPS